VGQVHAAVDGRLREFILAQPMFFVATAPSGAGGHIDLSPKGGTGCLTVLDDHRVAYQDYSDALYPIFVQAVAVSHAHGFAGMPTLTDLVNAMEPIEN
jgi:hypothetical protein